MAKRAVKRPKLTFANVIALLALFISLGGTVYAAAKINGKTIRKESIPANRFKADGLTGAQINESALGMVPRAASASQATTAASAEKATSATRADVSARADSATEATKAGTAAEAEHAKEAKTAQLANDARTLNGHPASDLFRADACETETIKAAVAVTTPTVTTVAETAHFNCADESAGGKPDLKVEKVGEVIVTFPGLPLGIPVASSLDSGTEVSVQPLPGVGKFRVTTFGVNTEDLIAGKFVLAIF